MLWSFSTATDCKLLDKMQAGELQQGEQQYVWTKSDFIPGCLCFQTKFPKQEPETRSTEHVNLASLC